MTRFIFMAMGIAGAIGLYMYFTRRRHDMRDDLLSRASTAQHRMADVVERARASAEELASQAGSQLEHVREATRI